MKRCPRQQTTILLATGVLLLYLVLAACTGAAREEGATPRVTGPALVMFYTDN